MTDVFYRHRDSFRRQRRRVTALGELIESRGVIASSIALAALTASATAGGVVASGAIQSRAAGKAADKQVASNNYAADVQSKSTAAALEFQKQEAARDAARAESTQRANYDQWAAREGRLSTLSELIGGGARQIPGYVPINQGGMPAMSSGTAPAGDLSGAQAAFDKLFPGSTLTPEMLKGNEAALKAAGFSLRPNAAGVVGKVQYGNGPIIDVIQGAGSGVNKKQWLLPSGAATSTRSAYTSPASSLLMSELSPAVPDARRWTAASLMGRG